MLNIFKYFKKIKQEETSLKKIELSKIDKHVNLILRERLGNNNKSVLDALEEFDKIKIETLHKLRELHKKPLMNPNIPRREIQIMEGNRDNYVKRISHFLMNTNAPRQYLELYYYAIKFSEELESLSGEIQKNTFILKGFFENEMKNIGKDLNILEEKMINIRVLFEKYNIQKLQEVTDNIEKIKKNLIKIEHLNSDIREHESTLKDYDDKIIKLKERIGTITTGTDYRALESFKKDKDEVEEQIKTSFTQFDAIFSDLDVALKKYYYKNPDKKIIRAYLEEQYKTFLSDEKLEISQIITELKENLKDIDLKDKKRESTATALEKLNYTFLKEKQSELKKLEDQKQHLQTKIIHNSASLNLSEQQYWINANEEKIKKHAEEILRIKSDIVKTENINSQLKNTIKDCLEIIYRESILLVDDLGA
ncbi:MAG: hypothetical protein ACP5NV_03865 [Candidatus Woesearchaeota archaeon]